MKQLSSHQGLCWFYVAHYFFTNHGVLYHSCTFMCFDIIHFERFGSEPLVKYAETFQDIHNISSGYPLISTTYCIVIATFKSQ